MRMPANIIENEGRAKKRFFVESCFPFDNKETPEIKGHIVRLSNEKKEQLNHLYFSLEPHSEGTSFEKLPNTLAEIPLMHSNADYVKIRKYLLEQNAAEKP